MAETMNMLERVARGIADADCGHFENYPGMYLALARKAVEAMREPTDAMIDDAISASGMESWDHIEERMGQAHRAAIDAALSEGGE